ncbi:MAG: RHS repeat-associated core domain-containing protein [Acidobacteriota bacterium]
MKRRYRTQVCGPEAGRRHVAWVKDVWAGRMLVATVSANPDEGTRYMAVDHLGTPRLVTDACAVTRAQHTYYPFGFEATASTQDAEAIKFTGHERDLQGTYGSQTDDLDYMHARHYSPGLARFLVPDALRGDPRRPQAVNLHAHVEGLA